MDNELSTPQSVQQTVATATGTAPLPYNKKIAVISSGTVGIGVVHCLVMNAIPVVLKVENKEQVENAMARIEVSIKHALQQSGLGMDQLPERLRYVTCTQDYADVADADLVIEAASLKKNEAEAFYKNLDSTVQNDAVFATNSSSLSISELASMTRRPERFIGMHFFTPVSVMKLVEVIRGRHTNSEVVSFALDLCCRMGKEPIEVDEAPGFVVNRLLVPMINEAIAEFSEGVASIEAIDAAMRTGANHPMGPLELADLIGLDNCLAIMEGLYEEFGDPKYRPHPVLRKKVRAGELGRKTGVGFYRYETDSTNL